MRAFNLRAYGSGGLEVTVIVVGSVTVSRQAWRWSGT